MLPRITNRPSGYMIEDDIPMRAPGGFKTVTRMVIPDD